MRRSGWSAWRREQLKRGSAKSRALAPARGEWEPNTHSYLYTLLPFRQSEYVWRCVLLLCLFFLLLFHATFVCWSPTCARYTERSDALCPDTWCFPPVGSNTDALDEGVRLALVSNKWEDERCVIIWLAIGFGTSAPAWVTEMVRCQPYVRSLDQTVKTYFCTYHIPEKQNKKKTMSRNIARTVIVSGATQCEIYSLHSDTLFHCSRRP